MDPEYVTLQNSSRNLFPCLLSFHRFLILSVLFGTPSVDHRILVKINVRATKGQITFTHDFILGWHITLSKRYLAPGYF